MIQQSQNTQKPIQYHGSINQSLPKVYSASLNIEEQRYQDNSYQKMKIEKQECSICSSLLDITCFKAFNACQHSYCEKCLNVHLQHRINHFQIITCLNENCPQILHPSSPHIVALPTKLQQKYQKIHFFQGFLTNPQLKLCPTEACNGSLNISDKPAKCTKCNASFCGICLFPFHEGNCDQNVVFFIEETLNFKQCKQCKLILERSFGCNHMKCRCCFQFCYECGQKWKEDHQCHKQLTSRVRPKSIGIFLLTALIALIPFAIDMLLIIIWLVYLILFSLGLFVYLLVCSIQGGFKTMISQRSCLAISLGNFVLLFYYIICAFVQLLKEKFCYHFRLNFNQWQLHLLFYFAQTNQKYNRILRELTLQFQNVDIRLA